MITLLSYEKFFEEKKINELNKILRNITKNNISREEGESKKQWQKRVNIEISKKTYIKEALEQSKTNRDFQMFCLDNEKYKLFRDDLYKDYMTENINPVIDKIIQKNILGVYLNSTVKTIANNCFNDTIKHIKNDELFVHGAPVSLFTIFTYLNSKSDKNLKLSVTQNEIKETEEFKSFCECVSKSHCIKNCLEVFSFVENTFKQRLFERLLKILQKRTSKMIKTKESQVDIIEIIKGNPYVIAAYEKEIKELKVLLPDHVKDIFTNARKRIRKFILHIGPTNSGKTYTSLQAFREAQTGVYLGPLRLLALEVYEGTNKQNVPCSLLTGEEEDIVEGAMHIAQTIEMANFNKHYDVAVIDEAQMISDPERGGAWTNAILGINADIIHVCMAEHAEEIVTKLIEYCGDEIEEVIHTKRMTPLMSAPESFSYPESVRPGDALIMFSKRNVISCAAELQDKGYKCSVIYGALPYDTRKSETERFLKGETNVVVATDAIGMGLNLPVKRIVFMETSKFDGTEVRDLLPSEIQQIAGRAGRKGMYEKGEYTSLDEDDFIIQGINTKTKDIEKANLSFPTVLAEVDDSLSNIIKKWSLMTPEEIFSRSDTSDMIDTCMNLENMNIKRNVILNVLSIPLNKNNEYLTSYWLDFIMIVDNDGFISIDSSKYDVKKYKKIPVTADNLNSFEYLHQELDLLYNFIRIFGNPVTKEEEKKILLNEKKEIAKKITKILKTKKLNQRTCSVCGEPLPFNYPYGMCGECYEERMSRRYGRWNSNFGYDWDDDDFEDDDFENDDDWYDDY